MRPSTAYRINVRKFDRMKALGMFGDDKVELLNGVLTSMTTNPPHDYAVNALGDLFKDMLPRGRWAVRTEQLVNLGHFWKPMPDVAVVRGTHGDHATRTPGAADLVLIVEVSDSSYLKDSKTKLRRYEKSEVPSYWIVDLTRRRVEVRNHQGASGFAPPVIFEQDQEIPFIPDGQDFGRIEAGAFFLRARQ